jgi:hypothetical protein
MPRRVLSAKGLVVIGALALGATAASYVGIALPASHDNHPTKDSRLGGAPETTTTPSAAADATTRTSVANHGSDVSNVARNTDATGRDKGAAVSAVTKGDHGQPPDAGSNSGSVPTTGAPVTTPNAGGIGTGADWSYTGDQTPAVP